MNATYLYPGSFCPATYGHLAILQKAAAMCERVTVICSRNPDKSSHWFTQEECRDLWSAYNLPTNIAIEIFGERKYERGNIVIVRGLRQASDFPGEAKVMEINRRQFGIDRYLYLVSDEAQREISSSRAREAARLADLRTLGAMAAPLIVTALLERALNIQNLFLVVGRPGGGKSTFCRMMAETNPRLVHINTDDFNHALRPVLAQAFPGKDLVSLALQQEAELLRVIADPWMRMVEESLRQAAGAGHVLVECAMGLKESHRLYRFLGGKVLCVDTEDDCLNLERVRGRGTAELIPFLKRIPSPSESLEIARRERLDFTFVDSGRSLADLRREAQRLSARLEKGEKSWKLCLPEPCLVT